MKGTVFAVALNHQSQIDFWHDAFEQAPYKNLPKTPVWFIKPRNTVIQSGEVIPYPAGEEVLSGATVAIVIGKNARKVSVNDASDYIAGYALANEVSLPETSFYRPAINAKCRDGFCPIGEIADISFPETLEIVTEINGQEVDRWSTKDLLRSVNQLVAALSDFATLKAGDMILIGTPQQRIAIHPGDNIQIKAAGFPTLTNNVIAQSTQKHAPKDDPSVLIGQAKIRYQGTEYTVTVEENDAITLPTGQQIAADDPQLEFLPPVRGTLFALGLNYADHAAELAFNPPVEPLIFIKADNSLTGHRQVSVRPDNIEYMHYESELVVVIGKTARNVSQADAMDYVAGYTLCNDYAIRDYLENYYRPNLRVKSRDTLTPIGPVIIDKKYISDPHNLVLSTYVNGELRQRGTTADLIFNIPFLIAYLSEFMTLQPGDMIATGTPKGLSDVVPGDEVIVEVEGVGRLFNHIISEDDYRQVIARQDNPPACDNTERSACND